MNHKKYLKITYLFIVLNSLVLMMMVLYGITQSENNLPYANELRLMADGIVIELESKWPLSEEEENQFLQNWTNLKVEGTLVSLSGEVICTNGSIVSAGELVDVKGFLYLDKSYHKANPHREKLGFPLMKQGQVVAFFVVEQPIKVEKVLQGNWEGYVFFSFMQIVLIALLGIKMFRKGENPLLVLSKGLEGVTKGRLEPLKVSEDPQLKEVTIGFNQLVEELSYRLHQQQKREGERQVFLNTISHELKTPISTINAYIEGLIHGVAKDEATKEKYLGIIYDKMQKLMTQIDDLFAYTQEQSGQFKYNFEEVYADDLFDPIFKGLAQSGGHPVVIENHLPKCLIKADGVRIEQVIMNLYNNGAKHSNPSKPMVIRAYRQEDEIWIEMEDFGTGIHHEELPYIFDYYYQGNRSKKTDYEGIGMGLAICKEIVEKHKGRIIVKSTINKGTTMIMVLPL